MNPGLAIYLGARNDGKYCHIYTIDNDHELLSNKLQVYTKKQQHM